MKKTAMKKSRTIPTPATVESVAVLANLAVLTQPEVRAAIEAVSAQLRFLPPYSRDFNPIAQAFAKLQAFLRTARPKPLDQVLAVCCELGAIGFNQSTCAAQSAWYRDAAQS